MKKILAFILTLCCLPLAACKSDIGIIGGADGPTSIYVSENGEEKRPVRMFRANGILYYDTGKISDMTGRCGTLDGDLTKTADEFEVPQKDNECNFDGAEGYQNVTTTTREVPMDEGWVIFKKIDDSEKDFSEYKYCLYLKGRLPNASADTEMIVLSDSMDVTVESVLEPLYSSVLVHPSEHKTYIVDILGTTEDKWGLTLTAKDVTPTGLTLRFEQFGGTPEGTLQTGNWFELERLNDDGTWETIEKKTQAVWTLPAFLIPKNDVYEREENWEFIYGALPAGTYRIAKEVDDFKNGQPYEPEKYYATFTITEEMCAYPKAEE